MSSIHSTTSCTPASTPDAFSVERPEEVIMRTWDQTSAPLVTIVCHTYNHVDFIADTVRGFLAQRTDFPFQIILRDDASTDGTTEIVHAFSERYPRLILAIIEDENEFSRGIKPTQATFPHASGEFVAMCEGDDYWCDENKLQRQVECLQRHPTAGLAIHPAAVLIHGSLGAELEPFCSHGPEEAALSSSGIFSQIGQFAPTSSYLFRANCIPEWLDFMSRQHPTFGDFFLECIASRGTMAYLPNVMSVYRRKHAGSHSQREHSLDAENLLSRFGRNAEATVALRRYPWVNESDIKRRLALLRLDYMRKLVKAGAFTSIRAIAEDGEVAVEQTRDWLNLHLTRRAPWLAAMGSRGRAWLRR